MQLAENSLKSDILKGGTCFLQYKIYGGRHFSTSLSEGKRFEY